MQQKKHNFVLAQEVLTLTWPSGKVLILIPALCTKFLTLITKSGQNRVCKEKLTGSPPPSSRPFLALLFSHSYCMGAWNRLSFRLQTIHSLNFQVSICFSYSHAKFCVFFGFVSMFLKLSSSKNHPLNKQHKYGDRCGNNYM